MSAYVCGLDVHKRYTYATIMGPDGEILAQGKIPNEEVSGFLKPYPVEHVAMEATTSIALLHRRRARDCVGLCDLLEPLVIPTDE